MANKDLSSSDTITTTDSNGRRQFIRIGAGFIMAAGAAPVLANDCDQKLSEGEKKSPDLAGNGSDSDAGENADRSGCGIRYKDKPKISRYKKQESIHQRPVVSKYSV